MLLKVLAITFFIINNSALGKNESKLLSENLLNRMKEQNIDDDFTWLLIEIGYKINRHLNCLTIITDNMYNVAFTIDVFKVYHRIPIFNIKVKDYEDLLSPNFNTLSTIQQARKNGCGAYIILITNGNQVSRLLRFGDRHRVLDTRAKYIMLHDSRLFTKDLHYLWKKIVNVIFLRKYADSRRYEFSTVPFPAQISSHYLTRRIDTWRAGKFQYNYDLFVDKTSDLRNEVLRIATFEHMPSVIKVRSSETLDEEEYAVSQTDDAYKYDGLEIQILQSLSKAMNFFAVVYEPMNANVEAWGRKQLNGTYSGLLGEVTSGRADIALGNLVYTPYNLDVMDLSRPYSTQCFTFLTPESTADNSWKTLVLPFRLTMWIAIMLTLIICTFIFFGLAKFQQYLETDHTVVRTTENDNFWKDLFISWHYKKARNAFQATRPYVFQHVAGASEGLYLFDRVDNSLLNSYSMFLLVSLPKMPTGWSLRMMTGWWWLYCLLVTVAYRASMTAILAKPAQRVTIDTLEELSMSPIGCGGWGEQNKEFFSTSLDTAGQQVGEKFETIYDTEAAIARVSNGDFAYYENTFFLHYAKVKQKLNQMAMKNETNETNKTQTKEMNKDLHVMADCAINMPISLGLQKNSPLKPKVDIFLQRVIEAGLIKKWLGDVMIEATAAESYLNRVEVKALMDLNKFCGALVALVIGYFLAVVAFAGENVYWNRIVLRDPQFDKYSKQAFFARNK